MKQYFDAVDVEKSWYAFWLNQGYFFPKEGNGPIFSMVIPPPNVTGTLHLGHAFQLSIMDVLWRYHRMNNYRTLWQLGVDHAGIATQLVVQNFLKQQGVDWTNLTRKEFIEEAWKWKKYSGENITDQQKRLGIAGDWQHVRFTLDPIFNKAVVEVFVRLYEEGMIYRGQRLINWDPVLKTAVSDLEVLNEEELGNLWYIRYPGQEGIVIATTRPETLFGDVAVAVNPKDPRYQRLIGQKVSLPLTNRTIPIIADEYVDMNFGTGCVKITPAHDFNDYAVGQRHNLPLRNILTSDACLNDQVSEDFRGLTTLEAREKVVRALSAAGLLLKREKHLHNVPRGDRTGAIIEPYLTNQWFVKMEKLAIPAIEAVKNGELAFVPENWGNVYLQWLEKIEDWCISRQLWWGHQIPAWYDEKGKVYVGHSEEEIRERFQVAGKLVQDQDVLDTWFSAALWPFVSLGWPTTDRYHQFYPTSILVTGFDIIFFWVARMVMLALKFTHKLPFKTVYITGLIRDASGQKMSKSKGNVLDPIDLIDGISLDKLLEKRTSFLMQKHLTAKIEKDTRKDFPEGIMASGTDALRFTLCSLATTNMNINFQMDRLVNSRHFITKLWNAARYILQQLPKKLTLTNSPLNETDSWIIEKFNQTVREVRNWIEGYRFDLACQIVYEFLWHQFCGWYLEFTKVELGKEIDSDRRAAIQSTLVGIMEKYLRLLHPFIPFVTEELWQRFKIYGQSTQASILLVGYPQEIITSGSVKLAYQRVEWLKGIITVLRNLKSEFNLPKGGTVYLRKIGKTNTEYLSLLEKYLDLAYFENLVTEFNFISGYALATYEEVELAVPVSEEKLLNRRQSLQKEYDGLRKDNLRLMDKLENISYIEKAPVEVVERDRNLLLENNRLLKILQEQLNKMRMKNEK